MRLADHIKKAKRVYLIGNGGSYANAVHICNDLLACGIRAFTLDPATLTATANDHGYETVFSRWLATVAEPEDLLIVLSGSGNSANVLRALTEADRIGMDSWAIVGEPGGRAAVWAKNATISGANMQFAEQLQVQIGHELMRELKS